MSDRTGAIGREGLDAARVILLTASSDFDRDSNRHVPATVSHVVSLVGTVKHKASAIDEAGCLVFLLVLIYRYRFGRLVGHYHDKVPPPSIIRVLFVFHNLGNTLALHRPLPNQRWKNDISIRFGSSEKAETRDCVVGGWGNFHSRLLASRHAIVPTWLTWAGPATLGQLKRVCRGLVKFSGLFTSTDALQVQSVMQMRVADLRAFFKGLLHLPSLVPKRPTSDSPNRRGNRQMYSKPPKVLAGRYLLGGTIGRGSYGKVKDCIDLVTLRRCAVKIVSKLGVRKIPGGWSQALTEACILRSLAPHRHIVAVATVLRLTAPDRVALVMEHCLGSVHDLQAAGVHASFPVSPPTGADGDDDAADTPTGAVNAPHPHLHSTTEAFHRTSTLPTMDDVEAPMHSYGKPPAVAGLRKQSAFDWSQAHHPKADQSEAGTLGFQQFRRLPEAQAHAYFIQPANLLITPAPGSGLDPSAMLSHEYTDCVGTYHPGLVPFSPEEVLRLSRGYLIKLADFGVSVSIPTFTPSVQQCCHCLLRPEPFSYPSQCSLVAYSTRHPLSQ
ncbi:unnamed protein product, partial [Mesocestoides corti]